VGGIIFDSLPPKGGLFGQSEIILTDYLRDLRPLRPLRPAMMNLLYHASHLVHRAGSYTLFSFSRETD